MGGKLPEWIPLSNPYEITEFAVYWKYEPGAGDDRRRSSRGIPSGCASGDCGDHASAGVAVPGDHGGFRRRDQFGLPHVQGRPIRYRGKRALGSLDPSRIGAHLSKRSGGGSHSRVPLASDPGPGGDVHPEPGKPSFEYPASSRAFGAGTPIGPDSRIFEIRTSAGGFLFCNELPDRNRNQFF